MEQKRIEELLRALEVITDVAPPPPKAIGDVPTHHFHRLKNLAAIALRSPEFLEDMYQRLESDGWLLPLPYDSIKQLDQPKPPGDGNPA